MKHWFPPATPQGVDPADYNVKINTALHVERIA
jgi:hypothetical protein